MKKILHIVEMLFLSPSFIVCFCIFWFSKNQNKADKIVDWIIENWVQWAFSIIFWAFLLYLIL